MTSKRYTCTAIPLALAVVSAATVHGQTAGTPVSAEIERQVRARLTEIEDAARALNPDRVFSFVLENDQGALAQNGQLFQTRDAALAETKRGFRSLKSVDYRFDHQYFTSLAPDVVLVTGDGTSTASTEDGRTFRTRFAQTVILRWIAGEWKVLHAHRSFPRSP